MQDFISFIRRSLIFKPLIGGDLVDNNNKIANGFNEFIKKIGSSIQKSRIKMFSKAELSALQSIAAKANPVKVRKYGKPPIRWQKEELIRCDAFGKVYMGMNIDSGELLAVKEVNFLFIC
ncbi:hypothetical protein ACH5RR_006569 [Cinchona calisaya]|uniref:Uncharacterized protein n=1 Tax=Cinchona calisaya TaxID=153742 RepID=A0ABD3APC9_9GENT